MQVVATDSFFKSLKKMMRNNTWYVKLYDTFRYDIPGFVRNIIRFRKELWRFRNWDSGYNLEIFKRSLEITARYMELYGLEIESSRNKKVAKMKRAIELLNNTVEDNFIEQAEKELGIEVVTDFYFEKQEDGTYRMGDNETEEERKNNRKIFDRAGEIEEQQWKELWEIFKGQGKCPDGTEWDDWYDGSGLRGWWD